MISSDKGQINVVGKGEDVLADFYCLIKGLIEAGLSSSLLKNIFRMAISDDKELDKKLQNDKKEFLHEIAPILIKNLGEMIKMCQEESEDESNED